MLHGILEFTHYVDRGRCNTKYRNSPARWTDVDVTQKMQFIHSESDVCVKLPTLTKILLVFGSMSADDTVWDQ